MTWLREPDTEPIPGYRLIEPLGTGGFGEVWKCVAPGGIFKAVKFVYGNLNSLEGDAARAEQELKALQRVKEVRHPFVVSMDRIEVVAGELVIVMELADQSLHDVREQFLAVGRRGIDRDALLNYLRDAADGLDHLNERHGLQHLDIKPRNLFVVADRVKVADFGLVKHLERSSSSGLMGGVSPLYAAPETFSGKISRHSDQYSLAIVYMELLAGLRPFPGKNIRQLAIQHMTERPDLGGLPEADRSAIARALEKNPDRRFPSCLAFIRALAGASGGSVEELRLPDRPARPAGLSEFQVVPLSPGSVAELPTPTPSEESADVELFRDAGRPPSLADLGVAPLPDDVHEAQTRAGFSEAGVLRPTLFVGVGNFGRRALFELRCRLLDRFGDLSQVPCFRFLYLDSDPEARRKAESAPADVALNNGELLPLGLQPVGNYRRRMLEFLSDWLPREKLYSIPRSLAPKGSRALARLAFCDHYLRLTARLKKDLSVITHPEAVSQSVAQTGLALREKTPRVFVFASAAGGSGGIVPDLGYALRRQLAQHHFADAPVNLFLMCGAVQDPSTPPIEQANTYATLTELNHFADPAVQFAAQYGPEGPRVHSDGPPFHSVYLLTLADRGPEATRDSVARLAGYVAQDVTTPLGPRLDRHRAEAPRPDRTPFRSFGTVGIWFPRGLLLRVAARQACQSLLGNWQSPDGPIDLQAVDAVCRPALTDPRLRWESLTAQLEQAAGSTPEGRPTDALNRLLTELDGQSRAVTDLEETAAWAARSGEALRELIGGRSAAASENAFRKSRAHRALTAAVASVAEQWENHLTAQALTLADLPGRRLATAEAAFRHMARWAEQAAVDLRPHFEEQSRRTADAYDQFATVVQGQQGGFGLFGSRAQRLARAFHDAAAGFARHRLAQEFLAAGIAFYRALQGRLEERLRDVGFCRHRLRHLSPMLGPGVAASPDPTSGVDEWSPAQSPGADAIQQALRSSPAVRVILPGGEPDLERAASQFVESLRPEDWLRLEEVLQGLVLTPLGGIYSVCQKGSDLLRHLAGPLIEQAAAWLGTRLPVTDVAEVAFSAAQRGRDLRAEVESCYAAARPIVPAEGAGQECFLLVPASPAGDAFGEAARQLFPDMRVVHCPGQSDLTFCREQGRLSVADLAGPLRAARSAYDLGSTAPASSPHSRFDIHEWMPLG